MQANLFENISGLRTLLEKVDRLKAELDALRPLNKDQEARIMQKFRLDWNYNSNSIEGNSLTYGETIAFLMEGLTAKGKPFKDHLDIKGHNDAINYLMDMIKNREELTEKSIRELHEIILVEPYKTPAQTQNGLSVEKQITLGAYKTMPNYPKTPTGEIHYYATPEETPAKMADLMAWLHEEQEKKELNPLIIAAVFHYRFVAIHPFDDGNGRMSRLLMNLLLMQEHYPPVVIKKDERNLYFNSLRQADAGELGAFVEFIGENLVHSLEIYLRGAKGENIEEENDWEKQITILKKIAESKLILNTRKEKDQTTLSAIWLEINIPLINQEMVKYFSPFAIFFKESRFNISTWDKSNEEINWPQISNEVATFKRGVEINIAYQFRDFLYAKSSNNMLFSPSYINIVLTHEHVVIYSGWPEKQKVVSFDDNITEADLLPIQELARMFYSRIEKEIEHMS